MTAGFDNYEGTSEIVLVLKQYEKVTSVFTKIATQFPVRFGLGEIYSAFGGMLCGKMIAGYEKAVYQYKIEEDEWVQFQSYGQAEYDRYLAKGCTINDDLYLTSGGYLENRVELIWLKAGYLSSTYKSCAPNYTTTGNKQTSRPSSQRHKQQLRAQNFYTQKVCPTPIPVDRVLFHSITNVDNNKVILVGGEVKCNVAWLSKSVYLGELTEDKSDVTWKELESMQKARKFHITFKMKQHVYVAGGIDVRDKTLACCERFDLNENKWFKCHHVLPYRLYDASVVVSADETFAVITGGYKGGSISDGIIIFTEQGGFKLMAANLLSERFGHVSILI